VECDAPIPAQRSDRTDVLHNADLIVYVHDRHEHGVGAKGRADRLRIDLPRTIGREVRDGESLLLQTLAGVENRLVLDA